MALTDHDSTDGIDDALDAAARTSRERAAMTPPDAFTCLPGIEITTEYSREQHILGYGIDHRSAPFLRLIERLRAFRRERTDNILSYLRQLGLPVRYEDIGQLSDLSESGQAGRDDVYTGRPQIAAAMVRMGYVSTIKEAFARYLSGEEYRRRVPRPKPTAEESIAGIRDAGGVAVLAHPFSTGLRGDELAAHVGELMRLGLRGLECHYGVYDKAQTGECLGIANSLGLIVTGGSDFHGPVVKPGVEIATGKSHMLDFNDTSLAELLGGRR
jgi:predicted metal-dependent phosphoesterase TrpH